MERHMLSMDELWQKSLWSCWRWQSFPSVRSLWYLLYMCQGGHRCGAGWMLLRASSSKHNLAWCRGQWHKAGWIKGLSHSVSHNRITSSAQAASLRGVTVTCLLVWGPQMYVQVHINSFYITHYTCTLPGSGTHVFISPRFSGGLYVWKSLCCEQRCNRSLVVLMSI